MRPGVLRGAAGALVAALCVATALPARAKEPEAQSAGEPDWERVTAATAELLSGYIQLDSTVPPGNETPSAQYLADFFRSRGFDSVLYEPEPRRGNLVVRLPATDPDGSGTILLLSHIDVVPADPAAWSFPPFSGAIRDGHVFGRGALDDKGQGAVHAMAMVLLAESPVPRRRDIVFAATAGEETDGENVGIEWLIEHHWQALGEPVAVWNEGGASTRIAFMGDTIINAIGTTEKRALWITLSADGEGGHGSTPVRNGAIERLNAALGRIRAHDTGLRATPAVAESFSRMAEHAPFPRSLMMDWIANPLVLAVAGSVIEENRVLSAMFRNTIALTGLRAGLKHNVIPRRAEATLDVRLLPDTDAAAFLAELADVIDDPSITIDVMQDPLPPVVEASPWDTELFRAMEIELEREFPGSVTLPNQTAGGSDSKWFREIGVPAYGYMPMLLGPEYLGAIHGLDERIPLTEVGRAVRVTYRTLLRMVDPASAP